MFTQRRKILTSLILMVAMICTMFVFDGESIVYAASVSGDYEYEVLADGTVKIISYNGTDVNVVVPSKINGKTVTTIGEAAFYDNSKIVTITFPNTITRIEDMAFLDLASLKVVELPSSLKYLGEIAFLFCNLLTTVYFPAGINTIDEHIFEGCDNAIMYIKEGSIAEEYAEEEGYRYTYYSSCGVSGDYHYIVKLDNTIEITRYVGSGSNVVVPSTIAGKRVTSIADNAFYKCKTITTLELPGTLRAIEGDYDYEHGAFSMDTCTSLTRVEINEGLTALGNFAFGYCYNIEKIVLPDSVTEICGEALWECASLESINIPDGVTSIGQYAFYGCEALPELDLPEGLTYTGDYAFCGCTSIESVDIPESLVDIGYGAFEQCEALEEVNLSSNTRSIGSFAFWGCYALEEFVVVDGTVSIGEGAFYDCINLREIYIPASVTSFGDEIFADEDYDYKNDLVIYGYAGSAAESYASANGIDFVRVETSPVVTPTPTPPTTPTTPGVIPPATGNIVDRSEAMAFVTRCYELVLGRTPDSTGLNNWTNSLVNNQNTGAHVAYGFFFSQEYINSNTSNEEFVTTLYNVFLDRQPDPTGLANWIGQLEAGATRERIFAGVANSREFFALCNSYGITAGHYIQGVDNTRQQNVNAFVARLYSLCLGRNGDYDGQANWVSQLINRQNSGAGVGYGFFFSQEFLNRNLSNEEYVATLYRVFLGREPDQAGFDSWVLQLNNGADRLSVFRGFAHSQEYTNICNSYGIERGSI